MDRKVADKVRTCQVKSTRNKASKEDTQAPRETAADDPYQFVEEEPQSLPKACDCTTWNKTENKIVSERFLKEEQCFMFYYNLMAIN